MRVELAVPGDRFVVGESVDCQVRYINDGSAPLDVPEPVWEVNWQPRFVLYGPAYPDGLEFSPRSAVLEDSRTDPQGVEAVLITVPAGEMFEQPIPLDRWIALEEPGEYRLIASLHWRDLSATSAPVTFRMEPPTLQSVSIGCVVGSDSRLLDGVWLQRKGDVCQLFQLTYTEDRPDLGEISRPESRKMLETGPDATDVLAPFRNVGRVPSFHFWYAWREGATLRARSFLLNDPLDVDLGAVPAFVVRPALMTSRGALNIFVMATGSKDLLLVTYQPPTKDGVPQPATIRWRMTMPLAISGARSALDGRKESENLRVVLVAQDGDHLAVYHMLLAPGQASVSETVQLRNAYVLPNTHPALRIDAEGISHASLLYETNRETHACSLAEMTFGADGKLAESPNFQRLGTLSAAPKAACLNYQQMGIEPAHCDWAILLNDNRVLSSLNPDEFTLLSAPAALPLELLVRTQATYLLTLDPRTGPTFVALP